MEQAREDASSLLIRANSLVVAERVPEAEALYWRALALDPGLADAANNLGVLVKRRGDSVSAIRLYRQALAADPQHTDAGYNLGRALLAAEEVSEAMLHLRRAALQRPVKDRFHNLGEAYQACGDLQNAEISYREALRCCPDSAETINNLSNVLQAAGRPEEALALLDRAVFLQPWQADIRYNRALLLLLVGRAEEGWREHEWRWRAKGFTSPRRNFSAPAWDGTTLPNGTLLVHWEQGLGDTLQFVRYLAAARERVGRLVLEVQPPLVELLHGIRGVDTVVPPGHLVHELDAHAALLSLPFILGESSGAPAPYLTAPSNTARSAKSEDGKLRVGLVWAGNPKHSNDRNRSLSLRHLTPLFDLPNTGLFSLQVGPRAADLAQLGTPGPVMDLSPKLRDFGDTAHVLASLDLLLTVDTAVAHLAGALGYEAWLMLPFAPDWRWGSKGERSHWYPHARLFRQQRPGEWEPVVRDVRDALRKRLR